MSNAMYRNDGSKMVRVRNTRHYSATANQLWSGYPASPVSSETYPYQIIGRMNGGYTDRYLFVSPEPIFKGNDYGSYAQFKFTFVATFGKTYLLQQGGTSWGSPADATALEHNFYEDSLYECNYDIFTDSGLTTVYKSKTTTDNQDDGISWIRDRRLSYKDSTWKRTTQ